MTSLLDVWFVAQFEVNRAIRNWRAMALILLYVVSAAFGAYLFAQFIHIFENQLADQLSVPRTQTPGLMLGELQRSSMYRNVIHEMVPEHLTDAMVKVPPVALFHFCFSFLLIPFFAASASAESISLDLGSRTLRYEALRTGRLELVFGRMVGQAMLTFVGAVFAGVAAVVVGWWVLAGTDLLLLAREVAIYTGRIWFFGLPFVGLGVAFSQLTGSAAWARVLAIGATASSWVGLVVLMWLSEEYSPLFQDVLEPLFPQGWASGLFEPGIGWLPSAMALVGLDLVAVLLGYVFFSRRDI